MSSDGYNPPWRHLLQLAIQLAAFAFLIPASLHAQVRENALSDGEVEKLRDAAYFPPQRVEVFIGFLNQRTNEIGKLTTGKRKPGREEDIHDQMEQWTSIADDLDDNLEDYSTRHKDIRKVLPRLLAATERWATALRTPPDNEAYNVSRKLALESLDDVRETARRLIEEQKAWFLTHPPDKPDKAEGKGVEPAAQPPG